MAVLHIGGYREYTKETVAKQAKFEEKQQELQAVCERQIKNYEDATKSYKELREKQFVEFLKWQGEYNLIKSDVLEQKLGLMEDRAELRKKIEEQKQLQQKLDELKAEVKELRKLKYAADRKAKGPVGVAR